MPWRHAAWNRFSFILIFTMELPGTIRIRLLDLIFRQCCCPRHLSQRRLVNQWKGLATPKSDLSWTRFICNSWTCWCWLLVFLSHFLVVIVYVLSLLKKKSLPYIHTNINFLPIKFSTSCDDPIKIVFSVFIRHWDFS